MNYKDPMNAPAAEFALSLASVGWYQPTLMIIPVLMII